MSKYSKLWDCIKEKNEDELIITFSEIENILGFPIDHSFLNAKKELLEFGYIVDKISMKLKTVKVIRK